MSAAVALPAPDTTLPDHSTIYIPHKAWIMIIPSIYKVVFQRRRMLGTVRLYSWRNLSKKRKKKKESEV